MFVIIHKGTGARLCKDNNFRTFACFGTYPECVKIYRKRGWAIRKQIRLFKVSSIRDTEIKEVEVGQQMDATGSIILSRFSRSEV